MRKILAGVFATTLVCSVCGFGGAGVAYADGEDDGGAGDTNLQVGGAKVPNIPWTDYTMRSGADFYPNAHRELVDYPAGMAQGHLFEQILPGMGLDGPSVGQSVVIGRENLDAAITNTTGPTRVVGLSEGTLVLDAVQRQLANDPTAPPPDRLSFSTFGDPLSRHAFGQSAMSALFPPGTFIPVLDFNMVPTPVASQYDTTRVVAAYDAFADFPDRPDNLVSLANAIVGAAIVHTPVSFTNPGMVPPQNIRTTVNSRGAKETTYLVPSKHLPLTLPLMYFGVPEETINQIDAQLKPLVDAGYARNDNPATAPVGFDPRIGMDPLALVAPPGGEGGGTDLDAVLNQIKSLTAPGAGAPPISPPQISLPPIAPPALPMAPPALPTIPQADLDAAVHTIQSFLPPAV